MDQILKLLGNSLKLCNCLGQIAIKRLIVICSLSLPLSITISLALSHFTSHTCNCDPFSGGRTYNYLKIDLKNCCNKVYLPQELVESPSGDSH